MQVFKHSYSKFFSTIPIKNFTLHYRPIKKADREHPNVASGVKLAEVLKNRIKNYMDRKFTQCESF